MDPQQLFLNFPEGRHGGANKSLQRLLVYLG
jgi:hypothetical protein